MIWTAGLACLVAGIAIGASVELGSEDTAAQRLAPVIAGASLGLAIVVLGSRQGPRLTKDARFSIAFLSAIGWLLGMIAVEGWILESPMRCSAIIDDPRLREQVESGAVDLCPHVTAALAAQKRVLLAGVIGFFVIMAVAVYVRVRRNNAAGVATAPEGSKQPSNADA